MRMEYAERLARAQRPGYSVVSIGGACPFQVEGTFARSERPFYLRARHGGWWLYVGQPGWPADFGEWPMVADMDDYIVRDGNDESNGFMDDPEGFDILDAYVREVDNVASRATPGGRG